MLDYVDLIKDIKQTEGLQDRAVIVVGGSYGGMLATWLRIKYPQWFQGAFAASAPILSFDGYINPYAWNNIATEDFFKADDRCPITIESGFARLENLKDSPSYYSKIQEIFNLCSVPTDPTDIQTLIDALQSAFGMMVMVDYPYASDFVAPLPAWPVNYACEQAANAVRNNKVSSFASVYGIAAAGNVYFNYDGSSECLDLSANQDGGIDQNGWNILYCNEIPQPFASEPLVSMFPSYEWDEQGNTDWCKYTYELNPQYNWVFNTYGGKNQTKDFAKLSNVLFSNGVIDPWHSGGVLTAPNPNVVSLYIEDSAHHLDLRSPNAADPASVTAARETEMATIAGWIDQYQNTSFVEKAFENATDACS